MREKIMTDKEAYDFILSCSRSEWNENPRCYMKAIRVSLISLGYNSYWVETKFRDMLERIDRKWSE